jgi:hypothetical protein
MAGALLLARPGALDAGYGCPGYFSHLPAVQELTLDERNTVVPATLGQTYDAFNARPAPCTLPNPVPTPSLEEMLRFRPKLRKVDWIASSSGDGLASDPVECVGLRGSTYFGLAYYQGEGGLGLGGIGRTVPGIGRPEIRRPFPLAGLSVSRMIFDGAAFWIATALQDEGFDLPGGLYRYDWDTKTLERAWTEDVGPCGYWINDMLLAEGVLWVATDLGVSAHDLRSGTWRHFVPSKTAGEPLTAVSCRGLYERLLTTLPRTQDPRDGACPLENLPRSEPSPRAVFRGYLHGYRPRTLREIETKAGP